MKSFSEAVLIFVLLFITLCEVRAQEFPWHDFKPRTLSEIIKQNVGLQKDSMKDVTSKHQIIIDADPLPSVIRMTYTGKTKAISKERKNYLKLWIDSFDKNKVFNEIYDVEMLVAEDSTQYWLLVQKQLLPAFEKEIKVGEPVDLYIIRMGGFLTESGWDWMFIVEEFRKPGSETSAFPWNDFERRTLQELVKINLADTDELKLYPDKGQFVYPDKILPSVVRVTYVGKSRAIVSERKKFIESWVGEYGKDPNYANLFKSEFLFKEGDQEYWLPLQEPVTYFEKNLKKGDAVDLYLIRLGGLKVRDNLDWLFLVEEFLKPK
jgi:hypothetical protein